MTTPPPRIYNWLNSQLSIARFAGSITINGVTYIVATHEEGQPLVRQDVLLEQVATTPAHEDARDAARYRWLRDNDWRNDEKMEPVIRLHLNAIWDEKIDAAMSAQARNKKGIEQ